MKKNAILGSLVVMMLSSGAAPGDVERTTALEFTASLFTAALPLRGGEDEKDGPDVFLVARIHGHGLGRNAALQRESLSRLYNLPDLEVVIDSSATELAWKSGTWEEYRKSFPRVSQTVRLSGEDYGVSLIPHEIDIPNRTFRFILEIDRIRGPAGGESLRSSQRIVHREILWNFAGPLAVGLYFPDRVYFLSWTIGIELSAIGGRFGSGVSWTL